MPYRWTDPPREPGAPEAELLLWPHRSLTPGGFVAFFTVTLALVAVPLLASLGSAVVWAVLPFFALVLGALWLALKRSWSDRAIVEDLRLWPDRVLLTRDGPRRLHAEWAADPHWVKVCLHETGGPVPNYVTLRGGGREVEIGAFLSEEERRALHRELAARFAARR